MEKVVIATKNKGKLAELEGPLAALGFAVQTLPAEYPDIEENGTSFEENALIKARFVSGDMGCIAIADDSGISVDALGGEPGIHSARYANDYVLREGETKDKANNRKLLDNMKNVPEERRQCAFHCAMAVVFPDGAEFVAHKTWQGRLLFEERGQNGFGYDPLFLDEELGLTGAEMEKGVKMQRSHRAKALQAVVEMFRGLKK